MAKYSVICLPAGVDVSVAGDGVLCRRIPANPASCLRRMFRRRNCHGLRNSAARSRALGRCEPSVRWGCSGFCRDSGAAATAAAGCAEILQNFLEDLLHVLRIVGNAGTADRIQNVLNYRSKKGLRYCADSPRTRPICVLHRMRLLRFLPNSFQARRSRNSFGHQILWDRDEVLQFPAPWDEGQDERPLGQVRRFGPTGCRCVVWPSFPASRRASTFLESCIRLIQLVQCDRVDDSEIFRPKSPKVAVGGKHQQNLAADCTMSPRLTRSSPVSCWKYSR